MSKAGYVRFRAVAANGIFGLIVAAMGVEQRDGVEGTNDHMQPRVG